MGLSKLKKDDAAKGKTPKPKILKVNKYEEPKMALNLIAHIMTSAKDTSVEDEFQALNDYSDNLSQKLYDELMKRVTLVENANDDCTDFIDISKEKIGNNLWQDIVSEAPEDIEKTNGNPSRTIAIGGGYSSGKSSFLNSLTGIGDLLPTGIEPVSMINTYLNCSGDTKKLIVKGRNIKKDLVLLDKEVLDCIQHSSKSKIYVASVLDTLYIDIPSNGNQNHIDGLTFVDTPGYNNSDAANAENCTTDRVTAIKALSASDAIIWCIDIEAGTITQRDIEILNDVIGDKEDTSLLIVFTKMDKKPVSEVEKILKEAAKTCKSSLKVQPIDIVSCSCLEKVTSVVSISRKHNNSQLTCVSLSSIFDKLKTHMKPIKGFSYWQDCLYDIFGNTLKEIDDKLKEFEENRQKAINEKDDTFRNANNDKESHEDFLENLKDALTANYDEIMYAAEEREELYNKAMEGWYDSLNRENEWEDKVGFFSDSSNLKRKLNQAINKFNKLNKAGLPSFQFWPSEYRNDMFEYVKSKCQNQTEYNESVKDEVINEYKEIVGSIKLLKYFKELVSKEKIQSSLLLKSCYDNAVNELKRINTHLEGIQHNQIKDIFASIASDNIELFLSCLSNGVDLTICNGQGFSPLTYVARCSNNAMMKCLIEQDIDFTMKDKRGYNALETAAIYHCRDICEMLIEHDKSLIYESRSLADIANNDKFEKWISKY